MADFVRNSGGSVRGSYFSCTLRRLDHLRRVEFYLINKISNVA